jgi:hypothetical protein
MSISAICPKCDRKLKAPDSTAGKKVRCPACKGVVPIPEPDDFVEPDELVEPEPETAITETPPPRKKKKSEYIETDDEFERKERKKRRREVEEDEDEDRPIRRTKKRRSRRRHGGEEHRGVTALVFGILSIVFSFVCLLLCWVFAAMALNIAKEDLPKIERGHMDCSGEGMTNAGRICAYVGTVLGLINLVLTIILRAMGFLDFF